MITTIKYIDNKGLPIYGFRLGSYGFSSYFFTPSILAVPVGENCHPTLQFMMDCKENGFTYSLVSKDECEVWTH